MVPSRSFHLPGDAESGGDECPDPTDVATDFFAALSLQDWERAIQFAEPRSLTEFRESQLALFASWAEQRDAISRARVEQSMYSWTSEGVLRTEQLERHGDLRLQAFPGAPTLRELAALPAEIFAARYLAVADLAPSAYRVFGYVLESDDIAHVVYRRIYEAVQPDRLDVAVLHLRRHDERWQVLLPRELAEGAFILFHLDEPDETDDSVIDIRL